MRLLLPVLLIAAAGPAIAVPTIGVAQEPVALFCAVEAGLAPGDRGGAYVGVRDCEGGATAFRVTFTVTEITRQKYKLPSRTLLARTVTTGGRLIFKYKPAAKTAIDKIRQGSKMTVKVKSVYTSPVTETVTDSFVATKGAFGFSTRDLANLDTRDAPTGGPAAG